MRKTYLELVNESIAEAKVTLDPLTSANFASPPRTLLYNRFKTWVNRAYKELMQSRDEWEFRMERANLTIYPRLHLTALAGTFAVGDTIVGATSGTNATVKVVHSFEDVETDGVTEVTLSLDIEDGKNLYDFGLLESINRLTPTATASMATVKGVGNYKIVDEVTNAQEVDLNSIRFYDPENTTHQLMNPINVVGWENWLTDEYSWANTTGIPYAVTKTFDGNLQFYPRLDRAYVMQFNFSRKSPELVLWSDTATEIPEEFEDYLMWKAIADYADWDSNQRVFARANKNLEKYIYWLERDKLPVIFFGPSRFNRR